MCFSSAASLQTQAAAQISGMDCLSEVFSHFSFKNKAKVSRYFTEIVLKNSLNILLILLAKKTLSKTENFAFKNLSRIYSSLFF